MQSGWALSAGSVKTPSLPGVWLLFFPTSWKHYWLGGQLFSFNDPIYTKVRLKVNPNYIGLYWSCLEANVTTDLRFIKRLVEVKIKRQ